MTPNQIAERSEVPVFPSVTPFTFVGCVAATVGDGVTVTETVGVGEGVGA